MRKRGVMLPGGTMAARQLRRVVFLAGVHGENERAQQKDGKAFHKSAEANDRLPRCQRKRAAFTPVRTLSPAPATTHGEHGRETRKQREGSGGLGNGGNRGER